MKNILLVIALFLSAFLIFIGTWVEQPGKYYDCRNIDFLPDVPPQVRTECRKMIKERLDDERNRNGEHSGLRA
jgi:hypothetical protein